MKTNAGLAFELSFSSDAGVFAKIDRLLKKL